MISKNKKVFTITFAVAMVAVLVGVTAYESNANTMFAEEIMNSMSFEILPSADAISPNAPIKVGAYIEYNCYWGFFKCNTTPIYKNVSTGETYSTQAFVPNVWGTMSDLEMHHTLKNENSVDVTFIGKHWGTLQDYSKQASIICNDNVTHSDQYFVKAGKSQDVRFCVMQDVSEGDLATWSFQLI